MIRTKKERKGKILKRSRYLDSESKLQQSKWKDFWEMNDSIPSTYIYNLTICDDPKFIWFRNAKVGTRSTFEAFDNTNAELIADHATACYYAPQKYKDYFKFAFVRNPWDRLVSAWYQKIYERNTYNFSPSVHAELQNFENFVFYCSTMNVKIGNPHFRLQSALIDLNEVDYIGKFENFDEDLKRLFKILGLPITQIPHQNKSKRKNYKSYYTEDTMQQVAKIYQKDIQVFGYTF